MNLDYFIHRGMTARKDLVEPEISCNDTKGILTN
jgi:hypothetical protein